MNIITILKKVTADKHWQSTLLDLIAPLEDVIVSEETTENALVLVSPKKTISGNDIVWSFSTYEYHHTTDNQFTELLDMTIEWIADQNS